MSTKKVLLAATIFIILSTMITMACIPPPPPPTDWGCSPGFWKNHPETWTYYGLYYTEYPGSNGLGLYEALTQKGNGDQDAKWAAVYFLNTSPYTYGSGCE
jgi:hypothetical protein